MRSLSVSFELTVATQGTSWMSDLQVSWKAPAFQYLYICASKRGQKNKAESKQKGDMYLRVSPRLGCWL